MNRHKLYYLFLSLLIIATSCSTHIVVKSGFIQENTRFATAQEKLQVAQIEKSCKVLNAIIIKDGSVK